MTLASAGRLAKLRAVAPPSERMESQTLSSAQTGTSGVFMEDSERFFADLPLSGFNRYWIFLMIETRGRKSETTMKPTTRPIPTIRTGSSRLDIPSTATSTSAS